MGSDAHNKGVGQLCFLLGAWFGNAEPVPDGYPFDWGRILQVAKETKTTAMLSKGCAVAGVLPPSDFASAIASAHESNLRQNAMNLASTQELAKAFDKAQISVVFIKGPMRTEEIYGGIDLRPSNDIDLLVKKDQYAEAKTLLQTVGYVPAVSSSDVWWDRFLGESPYIHKSGRPPVVDLHCEVQQPGGPYPRNLDAFFDDAQVHMLGEQPAKVLSPVHAALLSAISLGKAVRANEPWILYAHEMQMALAGMNPSTRSQFEAAANASGLARLAHFGATHSARLFDRSRIADNPVVQQLDPCPDNSGKASGGRRKFYRSGLLWRWTDGSGIKRLNAFLRGLTLMFTSDIVRVVSPGSK